MLKFALLMCVLALGTLVGCQAVGGKSGGANMERGVLLRTVNVGGVERKYAVYVPREYDATKAWPVIVFSNGMGECGEDGQKQLAVGLMPAVLANSAAWPYIVVCPQKPIAKTQWIDHYDLVMGTLAEAKREFKVDAERVYLSGLSQGGAGTWAIGAKHADVFAALQPAEAKLGRAVNPTVYTPANWRRKRKEGNAFAVKVPHPGVEQHHPSQR